KNANETLRTMLASDEDPTARANAARALGTAEDTGALSLLLKAAIEDKDSRVRVSAIRALGGLKDKQAADKLLERGKYLFSIIRTGPSKNANTNSSGYPAEKSELLEIAAVLGRLLPNSD